MKTKKIFSGLVLILCVANGYTQESRLSGEEEWGYDTINKVLVLNYKGAMPNFDGSHLVLLDPPWKEHRLTIKYVKIGEGVKNIGAHALKDCENLEIIYFHPANRLEKIGKGAFYNCRSLKAIVIPETVKSIENDAFNGCGNLRTIICKNPIPISIGENAFNFSIYNKCELLVPDKNSVASYKKHKVWGNFKDRIKLSTTQAIAGLNSENSATSQPRVTSSGSVKKTEPERVVQKSENTQEGEWVLIIESLTKRGNIERLKRNLDREGIPYEIIVSGRFSKFVVGSYDSVREAKNQVEIMKTKRHCEKVYIDRRSQQ